MGTPQHFTPTNLDDWARSDIYHNSFLIPKDPILEAALKNSKDNELPEIAVSEAQGKFLNLLIRTSKMKRVLEVGTLGGYSAIWMARALPEDGKLITLEISERNAKVAAQNIQTAGLSNKVEIKLGPAAETLKNLEPAPEPFDLAFIDADKVNILTYFIEAKRLVRPGGVIIVDNVVRYGRVANLSIVDDQNINGVRAFLHHLKDDKEVDCTTIATVGEKGYDGFLYSVRL